VKIDSFTKLADNLGAHLGEIKGEIAVFAPWNSPQPRSSDSAPLLEHMQACTHLVFCLLGSPSCWDVGQMCLTRFEQLPWGSMRT